jgi:hypothetical protein
MRRHSAEISKNADRCALFALLFAAAGSDVPEFHGLTFSLVAKLQRTVEFDIFCGPIRVLRIRNVR